MQSEVNRKNAVQGQETKRETLEYWKHLIAPAFLPGYCHSMISKTDSIQDVKLKVIAFLISGTAILAFGAPTSGGDGVSGSSAPQVTPAQITPASPSQSAPAQAQPPSASTPNTSQNLNPNAPNNVVPGNSGTNAQDNPNMGTNSVITPDNGIMTNVG